MESGSVVSERVSERVPHLPGACPPSLTAVSRVLIVEDDPDLRALMASHLGCEGYECVETDDGQDALGHIRSESFDLLLLDLMMPRVDGLSLCRAARKSGLNRDVPILIVTAKRRESDAVTSLDNGADDYLAQPFGVPELVARVRALLRRSRTLAPAGTDTCRVRVRETAVRLHDFEIDPARHRVRVGERAVELTDHEFRLLYVLATHAGTVFSREALLLKVWRGGVFVSLRSVDTLVKRLRQRLEPDAVAPRYVITVWGVGYKFADA